MASYDAMVAKPDVTSAGSTSKVREPVNTRKGHWLSACFERRINRCMCQMKIRCSFMALDARLAWIRIRNRNALKDQITHHPVPHTIKVKTSGVNLIHQSHRYYPVR